MKKKRRFGRRVFCVLIVLFMGVIWQSDLLSQEPAEVRSLRKQEILQTDDNYREYYFGLLTEDEKKIYREMLSGAVLALMMHINLWLVRFDSKQSNTYYQNVVSLGDELVNRNDNSYELVDMNRSSFIFKGGTKESLFEIAQNINSNEIFDQTAIFSNHFAYSCYINRTTPSYYYKREFLIKLFPVNGEDKRVSSWFNDNIYMSDKIDLYPKEITKFMNPDTYRGDNITSNSGNQIVFRFADAILLYAEALAAIGEEGEAQVQLNKIRDRAGATSVMSTGTDLQNDIFWERVRELIGEGHYYYDLVRTGKIHDINFCETPISRSKFNEGAWTWPICRKALVNNPYMTLNNYWE